MTEDIKATAPEEAGKNFILNFIDEDIAEGGQFQGMTGHQAGHPLAGLRLGRPLLLWL